MSAGFDRHPYLKGYDIPEEPAPLTDEQIDAIANRFEARRWVFEFGDVSPVGCGKVTMCEFNARNLRHFVRAVLAASQPAPVEAKVVPDGWRKEQEQTAAPTPSEGEAE